MLPLEQVVDHFDRAVSLAIDYVGIGSDYDGVGDTLPIGLKDVSQFPNLIEELYKRGYSRGDIAKILGGNTARVWREVEEYAKNQSIDNWHKSIKEPNLSLLYETLDDEFLFLFTSCL